MELWRKSNRGRELRVGLERGWYCLRSVCGIMRTGNNAFSLTNYDEENLKKIY